MPLDLREQYAANKEKDQRRRDDQARNIEEMRGRRWWHLGEKDPVARFTKWLVIVTALLCIVTFLSVVVLKITDDTLHQTLIENTRAWLTADQMHLLTPLDQIDPVKVQIRMVNIGHEPALNVVWTLRPRLVSYIPEGPVPDTPLLAPNSTCEGLETDSLRGIPIFPIQNINFWVPESFPNSLEYKKIFKDAADKKGSLIIDGCFVYRTAATAAEKHGTSFSFFLRDTPWETSAKWNFNALPMGNNAD
jgi:hypothetical protein